MEKFLIRQFKSGHPIGSSRDQANWESGLGHGTGFGTEYNGQYRPIYIGQTEIGMGQEAGIRNGMSGQPNGMCKLITYPYLLELIFMWEGLLPILLAVCIWRSGKVSNGQMSNSNSATISWLLVVIHSNLTGYFWIAYYIVDNVYGCTFAPITFDSVGHPNTVPTKMAITGAISFGIAVIISIVAAIGNDMYYPDAQMSPAQALNYINHLRTKDPEMTVMLKSRVRLTDHGHPFYGNNTGQHESGDITYVNLEGNWKRPRKSFLPTTWVDTTSNYPDINQLVSKKISYGSLTIKSSYTQPLMLKIVLSVKPQTEVASQDLNKCVRELARECGQSEHLWTLNEANSPEDVVEDKFKLDVTIPSNLQENRGTNHRTGLRGGSTIASRYHTGVSSNHCPILSTQRPTYVYINSARLGNGGIATSRSEASMGLDIFLRFAWILNLLGCSGLVLLIMSIMHRSMVSVKVEKKYGSRTNPQDSTDNNNDGRTQTVDLVVNLETDDRPSALPRITSNQRRSRLHNRTMPATSVSLPMPPPYTSREPSIAHLPMTPPPRYTSVVDLNSDVDLHVALPVNHIQENTDTIDMNPAPSTQPPSYQEAINSHEDKKPDNET